MAVLAAGRVGVAAAAVAHPRHPPTRHGGRRPLAPKADHTDRILVRLQGTTRSCPMKLDADDIEQIARRVADLIGARGASSRQPVTAEPAPRFIDAAAVARLLGVERDWVYEHAQQLGGIRLGGPRGRLRFDREGLPDRLAAAADPSPAATPSGRVAAARGTAVTPVARPNGSHSRRKAI